MRILIYTSLIVTYILSSFIESMFLQYTVGVLANITILISIFYSRGLYLYSGILFYSVATIIYLNTDGVTFLLQFNSMLGILALFIVLPFLNSLILVGRYDKHLSNLLQYKVENVGDLYKRGSIVSHILGLFLNIATVPILLQSLRKSLNEYPKELTNKFYAKSILRAYSFCLMWSPMEVMIIQTLQITNKNYLIVLPFLLVLVILFLYIDTSIGKKTHETLSLEFEQQAIDFRKSFRKIFDLFCLLFLLVASVSILDFFIQQGYLFSLVILMIPISLFWAWRIGIVKRYFIYTVPHWKNKINGLANFYFMFISAGFFVNMLTNTSLIANIQPAILQLADHTLILYIIIVVYFFISSIIGFHPLVSMVLLAQLLQPVLADIASVSLSIVIIVSSLSTVMYSPFHISTSLLAGEIGVNPYRVGMWNIPFALALLAFTILFSYGLDVLSNIL